MGPVDLAIGRRYQDPVGPSFWPAGVQGGDLGTWSVFIGVGLVVAASRARNLDSHWRGMHVVGPALAGLFVTVEAWHRPVGIDTGGVVSGNPGPGLVLTALTFVVTVVVAAVLVILDQRSFRSLLRT